MISNETKEILNLIMTDVPDLKKVLNLKWNKFFNMSDGSI